MGRFDSLCIMQDDHEDGSREAGMMSEIYQRSSLTIAALGARGSDEGCFTLRDPLALQPRWLFDSSKGNPVYLDKYLYYNGIGDGMPLKSRGREMTASDPGQKKKMTAVRFQFRSGKNDTTQDPLAISSAHERENTSLGHQAQTFLNNWCRIVENYTDRHLTFKSDRPHAISSLLRCLQERRGGLRIWLAFYAPSSCSNLHG